MIASLTIIYRFFEPHRWLLAQTPPDGPLRREGAKIGRNAPCPCSSGRKLAQWERSRDLRHSP
ncbi:SEC-C metal-binding domain-containing protein [Pseudomonas amygdali]|nr:SEC-C metal-binding domain-containing protein [Pseudomonas amygdali]UNO29034.1 SEC-C domain-containing protein [Pseudomonas amygdali pv. aesculi]WGQ03884.1 SEC-C metal-binding domain-containing protein [Pseudomonas amygdali pv. aesculi]